ncbi:ShlB/FhaC/HecB family hemolysin secretion/activation protein [Zavarzinia sp.]|uniref:ShlB/FhaC/HecB family hemolysin secretion/activation protein n=1 Tax=Zavarzinia sp. TaxID=2027920 RepID=UPI00356934BE
MRHVATTAIVTTRALAGLGLIAATFLAQPAIAQTLPGTARPTVAPQAITPPAQPSVPGLEVAPAPAGSPPAGAESVTLTLAGVTVEGATVYGDADLAPYYADKVGKTVTLADIFAIAAAIEARYRDDGYFLTRVVVPAQRIEGGTVKFTVVEGYIKSVAVTGDAGGARELVEAMAAKIAGPGPARLDLVERQLLLINDLPGITARSTLSPVAGERGASQLTVDVAHKAVDGFAAIDNRASSFVGPWSVSLGGGLNSFTPLGERLELVLFTSFLNERQQLAQLSGDFALGDSGLRLHAYAAYAPGKPGESLTPLEIETEATRFGVALSYPLLRSRRLSVMATGAFDWTNEDDDTLGLPLTRDRLRVLRALFDAEYRDSLAGVSKASLGISTGIGALGASEAGDLFLSRAGADGEFTKATLELSRLQHLFDTGIGTLNLLIDAAGQISDGALLADEEFRLGGYRFGRGYAPGELSGDKALAATIELQLGGTLDAATDQGRLHLPYQLYGFYDAGKVWNDGPGEIDSAALTSAGAGVRLYIEDSAQAELEVAKPLTRDRSDRSSDWRRPGVFFRLVGNF